MIEACHELSAENEEDWHKEKEEERELPGKIHVLEEVKTRKRNEGAVSVRFAGQKILLSGVAVERRSVKTKDKAKEQKNHSKIQCEPNERINRKREQIGQERANVVRTESARQDGEEIDKKNN
jgi:hypothetical protein